MPALLLLWVACHSASAAQTRFRYGVANRCSAIRAWSSEPKLVAWPGPIAEGRDWEGESIAPKDWRSASLSARNCMKRGSSGAPWVGVERERVKSLREEEERR